MFVCACVGGGGGVFFSPKSFLDRLHLVDVMPLEIVTAISLGSADLSAISRRWFWEGMLARDIREFHCVRTKHCHQTQLQCWTGY